MYGKFVSAMYVINILFQSLFNLASPILLMLLFAWLLVSKLSAPAWLYAVFGVVGATVGFYSMIKFIITASTALERLEKERDERKKGKSDEKQ